MTEKRFYMDKTGDLWDKKGDNLIVDFGYSLNWADCKWIIDLLNELNDENERLKKEYNSLCRVAYRIDAIAYEDREYSERLYKQNQRLVKMLDNVANFMQKQNKDIPLDDFVEWWNTIATEGLDD